MFSKKFYEFEVSVGRNGDVFITQESFGKDDQSVVFHPDQIDTVVKILTEARKATEESPAD